LISKPSAHLALAIPLLIFGLVAHAPEASAATAAEMAAQARASAQAQAAQARTSAQAQAAQARADALARAGREPTPPPPPPARDTTPPSVPTGLIASAVSCSAIQVSWNASTDTGGSGLAGYDVYRDGNFYSQVFAPLRSIADTGLSPATIYTYGVAAFDGAGNRSARSATGGVTTPPCVSPSPSPAGAELVGFVPGNFGYQNSGLAVNQGTAVVVGYSLSGGGILKVLDVSNPASPQIRGSLISQQWLAGAVLGSTFAYTLTVKPGVVSGVELQVIDIGSPASPIAIASLELPGMPTLIGAGTPLQLKGSLLYVAATDAGLAIIDVADPRSPKLIGSAAVPGRAANLSLADGYAYVISTSTVEVVDVRVPSRPIGVASLAVRASAVAIKGGLASIIAGDYLVRLYDVSTPAQPRHVGMGFFFLEDPYSLDAAGDRVFFSSAGGPGTSGAGLYALDISNPAQPTLLPKIATAGAARSVVATGDFVYVGDDVATLDVIRIRQ